MSRVSSLSTRSGFCLWIMMCVAMAMSGCGGGAEALLEAPAITAQPVDTSVVAGQAATFEVTAPTALTFRWQISTDAGLSWNDIAGATGSLYTADAAAVNGTRYRVVVTGLGVAGFGGSSTTSSAVTLTVTARVVAPAITVQPSDLAVTAGQNASFSITATGTSPSYQWQSSHNAGATYAPVAGATNATYALTPTVIGDNATRLRVSVSNGAGSVTSNAAVLSVSAAPATPMFTTQPIPVTVIAPAAATFTVVAVGTPMPALQWQLSTDAGIAWADIAGAATATFTTPATSAAQSGYQYRAVATNNLASTNSSAVALTVAASPAAPAFTSPPAATSVTAPTAATFTVTVTGTPTPTLQWQMSSDGGTTFANINGATAATFTTAATAVSDNGRLYRVIAANASASATSTGALLTVSALSATAIGPAGGTVNGPNGTQLVIPAGALATTISFAIAQSSSGAPSLPAPASKTIGAVYAITPHGTAFSIPAKVRIPFDGATITNGATPQLLKGDPGGTFNGVVSTVNGAFVEADVGSLSYFVSATFDLLRFNEISGTCGRETLTNTIWCWGNQADIAANSGLTPPGNNQSQTFTTPTRLSTMAFGEFVTGNGFVCGVHIVDVYCIGDSQITREVDPPLQAHWVKLPLPTGVHLHRLAAGGTSVCGIAVESSTAYCWGGNGGGVLGRGQLGLETRDPAPVTGAHFDYLDLAGGGLTFCALRRTGSLECWGRGDLGQIPGLSSYFNSSPVVVQGISLDPSVGALAAGSGHFCGLRVGGAAVCWGDNFYGQIGIGTAGSGNQSDPNEHIAPTTVPGLTLAALRLVDTTSCGLSPGRVLYCWGNGTAGEIGNGTHPNKQTTPVAVATPFFTLIRLSGSNSTMCGLTATAQAYCWGSNTYADLGSNLPPPPSSDIPVKVWDIGPFPSLP